MQSSLIRFSRSLAPHWLSIAAGAFLLSMFFLIGNLYSSQMELRQNADARLVSIGEARATEISDFLSERRQAAVRLAGSEDIANYFSNLDLGMSVRYGLFANLAAIERRFQATLDEEKYQGQLAYLRLAFFDRIRIFQVDVGAAVYQRPRTAERIPAGRQRRGAAAGRTGALTHCRPRPRAGCPSIRPDPGPVKSRGSRTEGIPRSALADWRHTAFRPAAGERG